MRRQEGSKGSKHTWDGGALGFAAVPFTLAPGWMTEAAMLDHGSCTQLPPQHCELRLNMQA